MADRCRLVHGFDGVAETVEQRDRFLDTYDQKGTSKTGLGVADAAKAVDLS